MTTILTHTVLFLAPLAGLIATFIAERVIAYGLNVSASASMGYYLYLIISIAMIAVGFLQYQNIPMSKDGVLKYINKKTERK